MSSHSFEYEKASIYGFDENELCRNYEETMTTRNYDYIDKNRQSI
jgi:hypothetical protein